MKHIALFLAIVIFALSLVSCSDLTYYKGAGWTCKQEDFYDNHYEPTREKVVEVAKEHGIDLAWCGGAHPMDDHFVVVAFDKNFTVYFNFSCEELWGKITVDYYFFGSEGVELTDYEAQKKYIEFLTDIVSIFAYDVYEEDNIFDAAYNLCAQESKTSYEKVLVNDKMTGGVSYGVILGFEKEFNSNHTTRPKDTEGSNTVTLKSNYFYFEGLVDGGFDGVHAGEH